MPSVSPTCIALVKNFEGFHGEPVRLPDGAWLVGYGHVSARQPAGPIGAEEAERLLHGDLETVAGAVASAAMVQITPCQLDALVCFAFSIGVDAFLSSEVLRLLNAGQPIAAACAIESWRMSGANGAPVVLDALVRRRAVEKSLFLYEGVRAPAPSALVRPQVDPALASLALALPARGGADEDETARRLREILACEPQTAGALRPSPPTSEAEEEDLIDAPLSRPGSKRNDVIGHAALGALGLLLIAMGVTGAHDDNGVAHIVFTAPGVIASLMAAFYLLKSAAS